MADFNSSLSAEQIESRLLGAVVTNATQEWSEQQKAQARANIGAGTSDSGLQIQGYFDTYEELVAAITSPKVGATYAVGTGEPYEIYIWDALNNVWRANGFIRGADGTDAEVTTENIVRALGYTPAATDGSNFENGAIPFAALASSAKTLAWQDIIVPDSAWEEGGSSALYPWRALIALPNSGVDESYEPTATFDDESISNADLSPTCSTTANGVYIYAASPPEQLIKLSTLSCVQALVGQLTSEVFATISVTYRAGATLTCTDGTTTLTAKTTSGSWQFAIPYAGDWTVSDGESSETVSITTEGQTVNIELDPYTYLYKDGVTNTELVGSWDGSGWVWQTNASQLISPTFNADNIVISGAINQVGLAGTTKAFDLTNYNTLEICYTSTSTANSGMHFNAKSQRTGAPETLAPLADIILPIAEKGVEALDVEAVNQEAYISAQNRTAAANALTIFWIRVK